MKDIGKKIRELRESKGMTQEELAHLVGYKSRVSINKIELSRDVPLKKLSPIAKALGVTPSYLAGWNEEPIKEENLTPDMAKLLAVMTRNKIASDYISKLLTLSDYDRAIVYSLIDTMVAKNQTIPSLSQPQNQE